MSTVSAILHHPRMLSGRSGLDALAEVLQAERLYYRIEWERLQELSWSLGHGLRRFGNWYYGSEWNALVPWRDERRFLRAVRASRPQVVHFLWAEFARPKRKKPYCEEDASLVGTFHASARKQPDVIRDPGCFMVFDWITLMSVSQKAFFVERGYPEDRIRVILHGVDTDFFTPGVEMPRNASRPLEGLLVGKTERDHAFAAEVMRRLPKGLMTLNVCTSDEQWNLNYSGAPGVQRMPWLTDAQLVDAYRRADLLLMPVFDCAANNVILEAMACGTPVMANRVGGISEYLKEDCSFIMKGKDPDEWVQALDRLAESPDQLTALRRPVRNWAERFDWRRIAPQFQALYRDAVGGV